MEAVPTCAPQRSASMETGLEALDRLTTGAPFDSLAGSVRLALEYDGGAAERIRGIFRDLTPVQAEAVLHEGSNLLILAGAGTGKTRVLTSRIALAIITGIARTENILALTFTTKAAREMADRLKSLTGGDNIPLATTFHAFAARMLRQHGGLVNMRTDWTILDQDDSRKLMRDAIASVLGERPDREYFEQIERQIEEYQASVDQETAYDRLPPRTRSILSAYNRLKNDANALDFGDLMANLMLFVEHGGGRDIIQEEFSHIYCDEWQDSDLQQAALIGYLASGRTTLTVVGDDDQILYSWRRADARNILEFEQKFNASVIRLEQNFRSTNPILGLGNRLIARNSMRLGKSLYTTEAQGIPPRLLLTSNEYEEGQTIAELIKTSIESGTPPTEIAVLARNGHALRPIEEGLTQRGIRYTISGGRRYQDRSEIRDLTAYLRLAVNLKDRPAFERAIAVPRRQVGPALIERIMENAAKLRTHPVGAAMRLASADEMPSRTAEAVLAFGDLIMEASADAIHGADAATIIRRIDKSIGYSNALMEELRKTDEKAWISVRSGHFPSPAEHSEDAILIARRIGNIQSLVRIGQGRSIPDLLDFLGLAEDLDQHARNGVWLGTIHSAKGLEFHEVYICAMEEGVLPSSRSIHASGQALEEERRICYVGITRARKMLTLSYSSNRWRKPAEPSRYLRELEPYLTPVQDPRIDRAKRRAAA